MKAEIVRKKACESWTISERPEMKLPAMEVKFLTRFEGRTRRGKIKNEFFREKFRITPIEEIIENRAT